MKGSDRACRAIRAASTESEVIRAVSDYLASLEPAALESLPAELTAIGLNQAEDVIHSALQVAHGQVLRIKGTPEADTLGDIVLVLSAAARRLTALARKPRARTTTSKPSARRKTRRSRT